MLALIDGGEGRPCVAQPFASMRLVSAMHEESVTTQTQAHMIVHWHNHVVSTIHQTNQMYHIIDPLRC